MAYKKVKLGDYLLGYDAINKNGEFSSIDDLQGINSEKYFQGCKSNKNDIELNRYRICRHGMFAYNKATSRNGEKISIAYRSGEDCLISPSYICFSIKDEKVLSPEYLMLWFKRSEFDRYARFNSWGSATEFFTWEDFQDIDFDMPSYEKQLDVVRQYNTIEKRISILERINDCNLRFIQAQFNEIFYRNNTTFEEAFLSDKVLSDKWSKTQLGDYATIQTGPFGSQLHSEDYVNEGTPIITVEHIKSKFISHEDTPKVKEKDRKRLEKYSLQEGDIVFSRVGSVDCAAAVMQSEDGWLFSGRCLRLRSNDARLKLYLLWWFYQNIVKQDITNKAVGSTMPSLNTKIMEELPFIKIEDSELNEFNKKSYPFYYSIENNNKEIRYLKTIAISILSKM